MTPTGARMARLADAARQVLDVLDARARAEAHGQASLVRRIAEGLSNRSGVRTRTARRGREWCSDVTVVAMSVTAIAAAVVAGLAAPLASFAPSVGAGGVPVPLRFREAAAEVGLTFTHGSGAAGAFRLPEIMGSGVALLDVDRDGDLDVFLLQGATNARGVPSARDARDAREAPGARATTGASGAPDARGVGGSSHSIDSTHSNRLFRNHLAEEGKLRFTDVTARAGLERRGWHMGVAVGDYDNDGDHDLYVTAFGPNALYRNDGHGVFTDVTAQAGVDDPRWNAGAAFADYDADGDLDLFVTAYVDFTEKGNTPCFDPAGQRDYCLPAEFRPLPARLFRNDGAGRFTDVTGPSGLGAAAGAGLGVVAIDANGDGLLDFYVANDGTPNHLWINKGDGTFSEEALLAGAAYDASGRAKAGMGVASGDVDGDGDEDLFVTNLIGEGSTLFLNDGRGRFDDGTVRWRLLAPSRPFTGFGTDWADLDRDGHLDLFIANGAVAIVDALRGRAYPYQQRNLLLRHEPASRLSDTGREPRDAAEPARDAMRPHPNPLPQAGEGDEPRASRAVATGTPAAASFRDVSAAAGPALALEEVSRGAAFGDLDRDGDLDIVVTNNNGPVRLLLNETAVSHHWLAIELEGTTAVRDGQGALVRVLRRGAPPLVRRAHSDGSYLSASESRVYVGLGDAAAIDGLEIDWRHGQREAWPAMPVDRVVKVRQGTGRAREWRRDDR